MNERNKRNERKKSTQQTQLTQLTQRPQRKDRSGRCVRSVSCVSCVACTLRALRWMETTLDALDYKQCCVFQPFCCSGSSDKLTGSLAELRALIEQSVLVDSCLTNQQSSVKFKCLSFFQFL